MAYAELAYCGVLLTDSCYNLSLGATSSLMLLTLLFMLPLSLRLFLHNTSPLLASPPCHLGTHPATQWIQCRYRHLWGRTIKDFRQKKQADPLRQQSPNASCVVAPPDALFALFPPTVSPLVQMPQSSQCYFSAPGYPWILLDPRF